MDAHNAIPPGTVIGYNPETDAERYHYDKASGITVIPMPSIRLRSALDMPNTAMGIQMGNGYFD